MTKKLIVNADDFGQSKGINRGIIESYENGIVTSTSLMVRYEAAAEAAKYARQNPFLSVGLHIDLGEWILKKGEWIPLYEVAALDNIREVEEEIRKQLGVFYDIMDRKPTHIDSHQHVHLRENICPVVSRIADNLDVSLRHHNNKVKYCGDFYGQLENGTEYPDAISVNGLCKILEKLPDGISELACHPGYTDDIKTMYSGERQIEIKTLCDESVKEIIERQDISLSNFDQFNSSQ